MKVYAFRHQDRYARNPYEAITVVTVVIAESEEQARTLLKAKLDKELDYYPSEDEMWEISPDAPQAIILNPY